VDITVTALVGTGCENRVVAYERFDTFEAFTEAVVLPGRTANPRHRRLDGQEGVSNREVAGAFEHLGRTWRVDADTHYAPLLLAYDEVRAGRDPFVVRPTGGGRVKLVLNDNVHARLGTRFQYFYAYAAR
jgi:hypothetical protein